MSSKEAYDIAFNNIKGRKKTGRLLFVILFFALLLYFVINSMADSVNRLVALTDEVPAAKHLVFIDHEGNLDTRLQDVCGDMEYVTDIYPYVSEIGVEVTGSEKEQHTEFSVKSYCDSYGEYLVEGDIPKENEILIPHYMYGTEAGEYQDGSEFIGQVWKLSVTDYLGMKHEISCVVSGTYDNIYAVTGNDVALIQPKDAVALYELQKQGIEQYLEEVKAQDGYDESIQYVGFEKDYRYAVVVDERAHLKQVAQKINQELDVSGFPEMPFTQSGFDTVFSFVQLIGTGLTMILLIVVIVMMGVMVGNDIRGRKKEMAMYLVQGYTKRNLLQILGTEYVIRLLPVFLCSCIVSSVLFVFVNMGIQNLLSMEWKPLHIGFSVYTFFAGIGILATILFFSIYHISAQLKKIELLKEIKSEG